MSPLDDSILVRECRGFEEVDACVRLQIEVWNFSPLDAVPRRTFLVAQRTGGQVVGAFDMSIAASGNSSDSGRLVGFAMAVVGLTNGSAYLHSHMLAVRGDYRNRGIGRRLKCWQRTEALARGINRMEWTFDPLEIKNCHLNLHRLGAIARRYTPNAYGASSSTLQGAMPTDRLYAEWWLGSRRVEQALRGEPIVNLPIQKTISIPAEITAWRRQPENQFRALAVQTKIRNELETSFQSGLAVIGFHLEDGGGVFELGQWLEPESVSVHE